MSVEQWLNTAKAKLEAVGIATARLDCLVLLEDSLGKDRAYLLAHPDMTISEATQNVLNMQIERRATHVPLAYIRGCSEFYGRDYVITPAVLEPRPESETMIELLLELVRDHQLTPPVRIADVGTGTGALGITAKLELPKTEVELLEINDAAIQVAKANVINHTTGIPVIKSDLLSESSQDNDILLCNLPYVPDDFRINLAAGHEPKIAIFGGGDGLDVYRKLFQQIDTIKKRPLYILTECLPPQHELLRRVAAGHGYEELKSEDFIQVFTPAANLS